MNNDNTNDTETERSDLIAKRQNLWDELNKLKESTEPLSADSTKRLFEIQDEIASSTRDIEGLMQLDIQRSVTLASMNKRTASTPANRRVITFNEESAIHQAIENSSLSKNLLRIEPCKPAEGCDTISAAVYQRWRKMLLRTVESLSEEEKESFFLRSAGTQLMDIYEMQIDNCQQDELSETPFSDILTSLDSYFESGGIKNEACSVFESMKRNSAKGESQVSFLDRLARAAKNCGFPTHEFDKKLMTVMARNTDDDGVRKAAIEVDFNGKYRTYVQFRNHLRHLELV